MSPAASARSLLATLVFCIITARVEAGAMYTVTDLGNRAGKGLNNSGQVVGNASAQYGLATYAFRYNSYGPNAGTVEDLGGAHTTAIGTNNVGQVIGTRDGDYPVEWTGGQTVDLGSDSSSVHTDAINDAGQIAGINQQWNMGPVSPPGPTVWTAGQPSYLGTLPGSNQSVVGGINASGQVAGTSLFGDPHQSDTYSGVATLWSQGQVINLGTLGGRSSEANAINDAGQIAGSSSTSDGHSIAFLYQNGTMTSLGTLPGNYDSQAVAINNTGEVVGTTDYSGFLYQNGQMFDIKSLVDPGLRLDYLFPIAINDLGQILTMGFQDGQSRTYLLTPPGQPAPAAVIPPDVVPVPEPSAFLVMALMIPAACLNHWRRNRLHG